MLHSDLLRSSAGTPIIQPWEYAAMRRRASGLSIDQVAAALGGRAYRRHLRLIETPGVRMKIVADLAVAMPFSQDVYRQLADLPPHQHPRLCIGCGWDAHADVADCHDGLTAWSRELPSLCTRCEQHGRPKGVEQCA